MNLVGLAFRNLRRRPMRTSLTIVGIGLAIGGALALVAMSRSIEDSVRSGMDELGSDLVVTQQGASDLFGGFMRQEVVGRIAAIPGVARASGELFLFAASERDRQVLVTGWQNSSVFWKGAPLLDGRAPADGERKIALLGDLVAETMGKRVGEDMEILGERFRVIGITRLSSLVNRGRVVVPLADLQELTFRAGQITMVQITLQHGLGGAEIERIKREIAGLGKLSVSTTGEVMKSDRNLATLQAVSRAISIIALALGVMNILNTLLMTIQERTREIGIVAALGWSDGLIMGSIVVEGLAMCAAGCVLGVLVGYGASFLFPFIPTIGDYLDFKPTLGLIAPTIAAAFVLCTVGSLYPAWRAVRLTPAEALQRA
jgi:putative ABC transport system permease protein